MLAALALVGAGSATAAAASASRTIPEVKQLYASATRHVRAADRGTLAKAVLYEADGYSTTGKPVSTAAGITRWQFVFDNPTPKSPYADATVDYGPPPRTFGRVSVSRTPFLEDFAIPHAPRLSLAQAVARLRRAGRTGAFVSVSLRDPVAPPFDGALYIFEFVSSRSKELVITYVAVNATNGRVSTLR